MSIPRIEDQRDYCMYWEIWTPSVWNIMEKLDSEKMDINESWDTRGWLMWTRVKFRNTLEDDRDGKEIFMWYANMPTEPRTGKSGFRYISKDIPQGLVMLETLGES